MQSNYFHNHRYFESLVQPIPIGNKVGTDGNTNTNSLFQDL